MNIRNINDEPAFPQKKKRGCFFYGCLTAVLLLVLGSIGTYFGVRYLVTHVVNEFTTDSATELPQVKLNPESAQALSQRINEFTQALNSGQGVKELVLHGDEINQLIANDPAWAPYKGLFYAKIENSQVGGMLNLALDKFGFPGRFLSGEATFQIGLSNGILEVFIRSLRINGSLVNEQALSQFKSQNLAGEMYKDTNKLATIRKLESIVVRDNTVVITRK